MKRNNKKGFTLVELLAVIVILAVVVLIAMTAVVPQMEKARKNAFVTELNKFIQGATNYYTDCQINNSCTTKDATSKSVMTAAGGCVTIGDLISKGYIDKKDTTNYKGTVTVEITGGNASYKISMSNGSYYTGAWNTADNKLTVDANGVITQGALPADKINVDNIGTGSTAATPTCPE